MPSLRHENRAYLAGANIVAGIDEAGRGPLAGPVVAAAAILPRTFRHKVLTDSKQLTPDQRDAIFAELTGNPAVSWGIGISEVEIIDRYNILRATWRAMKAAVDALPVRPDHLLIDGLPVPVFQIPQTAIVEGDCKSYSIAAASVIAKVTRDRLMIRLHDQYPDYNFAQHKGYATPGHFAALARFGPSPVHRKTFEPVRQAIEPVQADFTGFGSAA